MGGTNYNQQYILLATNYTWQEQWIFSFWMGEVAYTEDLCHRNKDWTPIAYPSLFLWKIFIELLSLITPETIVYKCRNVHIIHVIHLILNWEDRFLAISSSYSSLYQRINDVSLSIHRNYDIKLKRKQGKKKRWWLIKWQVKI